MPGDEVGARSRTQRLVLRPWRTADRAPFAAMNADPEVMRYFPATMSRGESDALVDRIEAGFADRGYGLWAVEVVDGPEFVGFVGLAPLPAGLPCGDAIEVGWRLARAAWHRGYATEAAAAAVGYGFQVAGLDEIVSLTATVNAPSRAVMRRLGMAHDPDEDFDHPAVPVGHPARRHVLYRLRRPRLTDERTETHG